MSTVTIEIDAVLLQQLVAQKIIEVVKSGNQIIASAVKRMRQIVTDDPAFDAFYERYPRNIGFRTAQKAWKQAVQRGTTAFEILHGLDEAAIVQSSGGKKYIPHPATWLNRDGWLDDYSDERTVHDDLRGALLNELRPTNEVGVVGTERLLGSLQTTRSISDDRSEAEKDQADRRRDKQFDPFSD